VNLTTEAGFRDLVRRFWSGLEGARSSARFTNIEGGGIEQQRDGRLQLHHCANYAAALSLLAGRGPGLKMLELGCGSGALSCTLARLVPPGWHLTATDYSAALIEHARGSHVADNLCFETLDLRAAEPGRLAGFDVVLFLEVIEHLPQEEARRLLRTLHAGLAPGACLVLSTLDRTPFPRPFSGYAPHRIEYTAESLHGFLGDPGNNPFERFRLFRLVSPRIASEAVRAEQRGGYFVNRVQRAVSRAAERSRLVRGLHGLVLAAGFRLYGRMPGRRALDLDEYLGTMELASELPLARGTESFGLVALLERGKNPRRKSAAPGPKICPPVEKRR